MVETKYGKISGIELEGYTVYKGIPYARAPIGELRFKRPRKPEHWEDVYIADHFQPKCMQAGRQIGTFYDREFYSNPDFAVDMSEDCLYLNIWVPRKRRQACPVAIYIHGGAFMGGAGSELPFDGGEFAKRDVILVTINYRLGVFGFFCHPLITDASDRTCGNYGLWDQMSAVEWVQDNITAFGGDPDNITLFGQSAGAMSLQILALSPLMKGKYHQMILQSGGGYRLPMETCRSLESAFAIGEALLKELGMEEYAWKHSNTERQHALRLLYETPAEQIMDAAGRVIGMSFSNGTGIPFIPVIDKVILNSDINELMERGEFHKLPYILGANSEDMTVDMEKERTPETNMMHLANANLAKMINRKKDAQAYVYYFSRQLPGDDSGAFHSAELWYVFGTLQYCWRPLTEQDRTLSNEIMDYWTNFMHTGNPNGDNLPNWETYSDEHPDIKFFDI